MKQLFLVSLFVVLSEQLLRSISPVPTGAPTLLKVMDPNSIAQVTQGVSMVSTTDSTEGTTTVIKMEPQVPEQNETVTSEKEKHPMYAMTSVMKNTAKGMCKITLTFPLVNDNSGETLDIIPRGVAISGKVATIVSSVLTHFVPRSI